NNSPATNSWDFGASAQAQLNQYTHMIYYSSQLIEMDQLLRTRGGTMSDELRTGET
ncbi:unnamed protein product, partial [Rotaria socialis]